MSRSQRLVTINSNAKKKKKKESETLTYPARAYCWLSSGTP
jgi:hypothetical protein